MKTRRFQFTLKFLMGTIATTALAFSAVAPAPSALTGLLTFSALMILPAIVFVGIMFGRGAGRAFCVGAAVPLTLGLYIALDFFPIVRQNAFEETSLIKTLSWGFGDFTYRRVAAAMIFAAAPISGAAAILAYLLFDDRVQSKR